jgi:anaerobic ribonucleoside-triphosphate reductase
MTRPSSCPADEEKAAADEQPKRRVPCEVYSRIVGYLRPIQAWNDGKRQEFRERVTFDAGKG